MNQMDLISLVERNISSVSPFIVGGLCIIATLMALLTNIDDTSRFSKAMTINLQMLIGTSVGLAVAVWCGVRNKYVILAYLFWIFVIGVTLHALANSNHVGGTTPRLMAIVWVLGLVGCLIVGGMTFYDFWKGRRVNGENIYDTVPATS